MTRPTDKPERADGDPLATVVASDVETVQVLEETARIEKRSRLVGRVEVRTETDIDKQLVRESLERVDVTVTRVPIGRTLAAGDPFPEVRTEGDVTIVPVLEEVLVVEKRLVLTEEVHLRRVSSAEVQEIPVDLRKQRAVVSRH